MSMNIFKLYLGNILRQCDFHSDSTADSGPLQLYHQHPRSEIGAVLTSRPELGPPGPFIPKFYKECTFINVKSSTEIGVYIGSFVWWPGKPPYTIVYTCTKGV